MNPDFNAMLRAKHEADRHMDQVLMLLAPTNDGETSGAGIASGLVEFHLSRARRAVNLFEDACHA